MTLRVVYVGGAPEEVGFPIAEWLQDPRFVRARLFALEANQLDVAVQRALFYGRSDCLHRVEPDRQVRWKRTIFRSVASEAGRGTSLAAVTVDATGRKRIEAELMATSAAVRQREDLLAVASHELRSPLASLRIAEQALRRTVETMHGALPTGIGALMGLLATPIDQLGRLVDVLFDVANIQAGTFRIPREQVDLAEIARKVVAEAKLCSGRPATITLQTPPSVVGQWNEARLFQVLTNLVSNALKYGAGKPVELRIELRAGSRVLVTVRDHGIGIPPEEQTLVFTRFGRAAGARDYPGLGLGLYVVRQIVEALGGRIEVESVPGEGAVFRVDLPIEPAKEAERERSPEEGVRDERAVAPM